jgi:5-methylthioadenosine/S-adenosylhomocysteine deaminase
MTNTPPAAPTTNPTWPTTVDTVIAGATIWPSWDSEPIANGVIVINDAAIVALGPSTLLDDLRTANVTVRERIDGTGRLITPGLVDAHTHLALSGARGATWRGGHPVYDVFWPLESRLTHEHVQAFATVGAAESLLCGTTTVNDHYFFADAVAEACVDIGIRAVVGECVMTVDGPWAGPKSAAVAESFTRRWHQADPLITVAVAPHAPDTVDDNTLRQLGELAAELSVPLHLHLSQTAREVATIAERSGLTPIAHLASLQLAAPTIVAAHCTYLADGDVARLAEQSHLTAIFCPTVHALDGRVLPVVDVLASGGRVAIGTDAAPNERRSMHQELSIAVTLQGALTGRGATAFAPQAAWRAATATGAAALQLPVGSLGVGAPADLVMWRFDQPNSTPPPDPAIALVLALGSRDVDNVMVAGRWRVKAGALVDVDQEKLLSEASVAADAVLPRS